LDARYWRRKAIRDARGSPCEAPPLGTGTEQCSDAGENGLQRRCFVQASTRNVMRGRDAERLFRRIRRENL
jgi:hypothetical protein